MKSLKACILESLHKTGWQHVVADWTDKIEPYDAFDAYVADMDGSNELAETYSFIFRGGKVSDTYKVTFFDRKDNRINLQSYDGTYIFYAKKNIRSYKELTPEDIKFGEKLGINRTLGASQKEREEAAEVICWVFNHSNI